MVHCGEPIFGTASCARLHSIPVTGDCFLRRSQSTPRKETFFLISLGKPHRTIKLFSRLNHLRRGCYEIPLENGRQRNTLKKPLDNGQAWLCKIFLAFFVSKHLPGARRTSAGIFSPSALVRTRCLSLPPIFHQDIGPTRVTDSGGAGARRNSVPSATVFETFHAGVLFGQWNGRGTRKQRRGGGGSTLKMYRKSFVGQERHPRRDPAFSVCIDSQRWSMLISCLPR